MKTKLLYLTLAAVLLTLASCKSSKQPKTSYLKQSEQLYI